MKAFSQRIRPERTAFINVVKSAKISTIASATQPRRLAKKKIRKKTYRNDVQAAVS